MVTTLDSEWSLLLFKKKKKRQTTQRNKQKKLNVSDIIFSR